MLEQIVLLVSGFLLTSVLGALLGWYLQQRSWEQQNRERLREDELRRAGELCQNLGRLLDKRRYRMLRLLWALQGVVERAETEGVVDERRAAYDRVLYEYNDTLNVNLSLVGVYFGEYARSLLAEGIYETFAAADQRLTDVTRASLRGDEPDTAELQTARGYLESLDEQLYRLNIELMSRVRDGRVGSRAR